MPPTSPNTAAGALLQGLAGSPTPIKNKKWARVSKLDNGFLIEMQNENDYQQTSNVALDSDSAMEIARTYFN